MRKVYFFLLCFILCAVSILVSFRMGKHASCCKGEIRPKIQYVELEEETDTLSSTGEEPEGILFPPTRLKDGVIPDYEAAANIAYDYVSAVFGEKSARDEQPYKIKLINNQIWFIEGSLEPNHVGGSFFITIEKYTGKIWDIGHWK